MQNSRIAVVGSLNADLVVHTERFPQPGETLQGSELAIVSGGKGANQAVAAGKLGGNVTLIGAVGADAHGDFLKQSVARAGVDHTHVRTLDGVATGTAVITVDGRGENTIIVSPGANGQVGRQHLDEAEAAFNDTALVCLCLEINTRTVLDAARRAHAVGARVLFNLSPYAEVPGEMLRLTDILLVNEHEAHSLTGISPSDGGWLAIADALQQHGVAAAVITLGASGSVVITENREIHEISSPRVTAVDTTGCGDAFMGALALRLAEGESLVAAARFASTVASYAATGHGAQASYPTREQLVEFIRGRQE
ncbi:ribokinase [Lysinibacter sp. HNR]|uniref:ribokinase n=1 Tax=Lysinibacter sp. HNR TaxID=3031408 RepID=UPI0024354506|nr:ribokinase [Lysinibacter sp. HNR]WGD37522.1 ribokinase [Lysinibacter sp. HNR]